MVSVEKKPGATGDVITEKNMKNVKAKEDGRIGGDRKA